MQVTKMKGGSEAFESADGKFVFYAKLDAPGIWRVPAEGGEETQVLDQGGQNLWAVAHEGICFFDLRNPAGVALKLFSLPVGKTTLIRQFSKETIVDPNSTALSVSPDGRSILYTQIDQDSSDLMLVENFR